MNKSAFQTLIRTCLAISGILACSWSLAADENPPESLLVVVGNPMPKVRIGHENHCTEMQDVNPDPSGDPNRLNVILAANSPNWISISGEVGGKACESTTSLVPSEKTAFIARLSKWTCDTQLFVAKHGETPRLINTGNASNTSTLLCAASAGAQDEARLAIFGEEARFLVGHEGYCGKMKDFDANDKSGAVLKADMLNWVSLHYRTYGGRANTQCEVSFSMLPKSRRAYYLQSKLEGGKCTVSLFGVEPDGRVSQEVLMPEKEHSCIFGQ